MPHSSPLGAWYVELDGANSYLSVPDALQYQPGAQGELVLHCAFIDFPASGTATIFGKDTVGQKFQLTSAGILSFVSTRAGGSVTVTATTALTRGVEYILFGIDDGSTVKLYVNGTQVGSTGTSQTGLLTKNANPWYVGNDIADVLLTKMRVYGFGMRLDQEIVGRWRIDPNALNAAGVAIAPDRTNFGNHATIAGTVATQYVIASAWQPEPAYAGKVSL